MRVLPPVRIVSVDAATSESGPLWRGMLDVRWEVFVMEQGVPMVLEIDARDFRQDVVHLVALNKEAASAFPSQSCVDESDLIVGTVRIIPDGEHRYHLGRLAVLPQARGRAIGTALVKAAHDYVRMLTPGDLKARVFLDSQLHARGFYEHLGYQVTSEDTFWDADIEHCEMMIDLSERQAGQRTD